MTATSRPSTARALFLDSGCGQSIFNCPEAFTDISSCLVEVIGVGSSVFIHGEGTARVLLLDKNGDEFIGILNNCLQGSGDHNLLSVSQIQSCPDNEIFVRHWLK